MLDKNNIHWICNAPPRVKCCATQAKRSVAVKPSECQHVSRNPKATIFGFFCKEYHKTWCALFFYISNDSRLGSWSAWLEIPFMETRENIHASIRTNMETCNKRGGIKTVKMEKNGAYSILHMHMVRFSLRSRLCSIQTITFKGIQNLDETMSMHFFLGQ